MGTSYFTDADSAPTEDRIVAALGRAAGAWHALFDALHTEHPELVGTWAYYKDGGSWLLKVARRTRTVFWVVVEKGGFRVGFYFAERLVDALLASDLSDPRKADIRGTAPMGKLRAVSVKFGPKRGVRDVMVLVRLKTSLK